ncbi:MAG: ester cyclase [Calditrichia bacterium]
MYRTFFCLALLVILLCSCVSEKEKISKDVVDPASETDLTHTAKRLINECLNPQNADMISTFYNDDIVFHAGVNQTAKGHEAIAEVFKFYQSNFPNMRYTVEDLFQSGNKVVVRWISNLDPSDEKSLNIPGISILEYRNGKVQEVWQEWDKSLQQKQSSEME